MFVLFCYLIAFIPLAAAAALWFFSKKIAWWKSLVLCSLGVITVFIFHWLAIRGMTGDTETWSGQVTEAVFVPRWKEYYEYAVYRTETYWDTESYTDSNGNRCTRPVMRTREVFDHWEPTTRWHNEYWHATDTVNGNNEISQARYEEIVKLFGGGKKPIAGRRETGEHNSRMLEGDPMDYHAVNKNNFVYPTNATRRWENKVKAAPSVFSYQKVPESANIPTYPENPDMWTGGRTVGRVGVTGFNWDQMNSRLGPVKKVNVIAVNANDIGEANLIESKWIGGKKNDIIITFGGTNVCKPSWCYVFGWSESDLCKKNLETIILKHGLTNDTIPMIEKEIFRNYEIKQWSKFDYLTVEVPFYYYIWLILIICVICGGWIIYSLLNGINKIN